MAPIRIQNLQWLGAAIVAVSGLLLGGSALLANVHDRARYDVGVAELTQFKLVLDVANAVSAERGPANAALGADAEQMPGLVAALAVKRASVDAEIAGLTKDLTDKHDDLHAFGLDDLRNALAAGRAAVDRLIAVPAAERSGLAVSRTIESMFSAADSAAMLRNDIGQHIIETTPQITTEIMLTATASELREFEGRLGSYVVMMLASDATQDAPLLTRLAVTEAHVLQLRNMLGGYAGAYLSETPVLAAMLESVDTDYFGKALPYAWQIAQLGDAASISAADFTANYVPGMASSERLHDLIITKSMTRLWQLRKDASTAVFRSVALTGVIVLVLLGLGLLFRRILFMPLASVREQILAVASGDLTEPPATRPIGSEIRDMLAGVAVLRQHQREKQRLEREQRRMTQRLKSLAETDTLTGLPNRRALRDAAEQMFDSSASDSQPIAVIIFDVDHFKVVNDTYGHSMGDVVLKKIGKILPPLLRPNDIIARYGGEEFVVLLRNTDIGRASLAAERMRASLSQSVISRQDQLFVTASFGVAVRQPSSSESWEQIMATADRRLYTAKRCGRNQVCFSDPGESIAASA
jgi:diguanylate cyclase (GGDEF)-like protein